MSTSLREYVRVYRTLSRDAKLLIAAGMISSIPFGVVAVALPIYLSFLGYPEVVIGGFFSIVGAVAVVLAIPFGILADRFGRKRMMIVGGVTGGFAFMLLPSAENPVVLYASAITAGLSQALAFSTLQALLADASTEENRTTVFGVSFFLGAAATALASLAASSPDYLRSAGWDVVAAYSPLFLGTAATLIFGAVILLWVRLPERGGSRERSLLPRRSARIISKFFVANIIIGLGAGLIVPIFSLWFFLKFGQTEGFVGPLFAAGNALNAVAFLAAPVLAGRHGLVRTVVALQGTATFLLLGMALTPPATAWLMVASALYLGRNATMNMTWPVMTSFLMGTVDPAERSAASAVVGVSFRLPFAVSTAFGGAMMAQDADLPLFVTTSLYAVGTAAFAFFFRHVRVSEPGAVLGSRVE